MKIPSCKNFEAKEGMGVSSGRRGRIHLGGEGETPQNRGAGLGQPHPDPTNDEQHDRLPERAVPCRQHKGSSLNMAAKNLTTWPTE